MACRSGECGHSYQPQPKWHLALAAIALIVATITLAWVCGRAQGEEIKYPHVVLKAPEPKVQIMIYRLPNSKSSGSAVAIGRAMEQQGWSVIYLDAYGGMAGVSKIKVAPTTVIETVGADMQVHEEARIEGAAPAETIYAAARAARNKIKPPVAAPIGSAQPKPDGSYPYKIDEQGRMFGQIDGEWKDTGRRFIKGPTKEWNEIIKLPAPAIATTP
jgi:hypothetical protein